MYNIGMKDAVPLLHTLLQSTHRLQPFQFRSQTPLQKGMPAEGTILQPVPDKLREGGAVVSALSVGKTQSSEANNFWLNRACVYLKQRFYWEQTEPLFEVNRPSFFSEL